MPPPGRRKDYAMPYFLLLVLLVFSIGASAAPAALGIDLGTEYIKAAIARPGSPIEIVLTKDSKRKEAAALAFKPSRLQKNDQDAFPERLYGGDALAIFARYPGDVYPNLKPLLGIPLDHEMKSLYEKRYPGLQMQSIDREDGGNSIGFKSSNLGKPEPFMVEELLAMELQNIKANAEAMVGKNSLVSDVVITYPAFYTAEEKRALQLAADLAGLRVLALMSDGQAVGLNYATTRAFDPKKPEVKPEYHIVYDMGAGSTTVTVLKFHGKVVKGVGKKNSTVHEVQVLGVGSDRVLGGDLFNDLIVDDLTDKFVQTSKAKAANLKIESVRKDGKTMARIWKDAEKVRQILSANSQASASFEGLFNEDINFKYTLTRAEFEGLAESYSARLSAPLLSALKMAGLNMEEITSVILYGGMTRTPFVQSQIETAVGDAKKVKTNINADEAAAFGAAFKAAGLSLSFRVRDIRTVDIAGSTYIMKWSSDGKERQQKLFLETSAVGTEKQVVIKSTDDLQIQFWQTSPDELSSQKILSIEAANLTKSAAELRNSYGCVNTNITTLFNIRLNPYDGLPEIVSGTVSCEAQKPKDGSVIDNVKGLFGFGSKKEDQQPLQDEDGVIDDEERLSQTPLPVDDPTSSGTIVSSAHPTNAKAVSTTASAKSKPSTATIPLLLKSTALGPGTPPRKALPVIKQRLTAFDNSDRNSMLRSEALNVLEAFTYRARDYLQDEVFMSFSTEAARKELETQLSKVSDWLYGDGTDAKLQEFKDRLKSLKALVDPVLRRKEEKSKREQAIESFQSAMSGAVSMLEAMKDNIAQAAAEVSLSASSVASSIAESASSIASSVGPDDDLEDEPYSTVSSAGAEETESIKPTPYRFSTEELTSVEKAYNSAKSWFEEKLALQEKLTSFDDPALLVADLENKGKQLSNVVSEMIMKQIRMQQIPKSRKPKTSKKPKSKKTKPTAVFEESVVEETRATVVDESASATPTSSTKDEL